MTHTVAAGPGSPSQPLTGSGTRALLAAGVVGGPLFVGVTLAQMLTRDGFDPRLHPLSLLSIGGPGWIQIINFIVAGVLFVACAVGMRQVLHPGRASTLGASTRRRLRREPDLVRSVCRRPVPRVPCRCGRARSGQLARHVAHDWPDCGVRDAAGGMCDVRSPVRPTAAAWLVGVHHGHGSGVVRGGEPGDAGRRLPDHARRRLAALAMDIGDCASRAETRGAALTQRTSGTPRSRSRVRRFVWA